MVLCAVCDIISNRWAMQNGKIIIQEAQRVKQYAKS